MGIEFHKTLDYKILTEGVHRVACKIYGERTGKICDITNKEAREKLRQLDEQTYGKCLDDAWLYVCIYRHNEKELNNEGRSC